MEVIETINFCFIAPGKRTSKMLCCLFLNIFIKFSLASHVYTYTYADGYNRTSVCAYQGRDYYRRMEETHKPKYIKNVEYKRKP